MSKIITFKIKENTEMLYKFLIFLLLLIINFTLLACFVILIALFMRYREEDIKTQYNCFNDS